jgi:FAD/FMN-containing dehydrogenase
MTVELIPTAARELADVLPGRVHLPGDAAYDAARRPWNIAVDQRPAAVAVPRTAEQVSRVVRAAAAAGLRVAPQSTGHNAAPLAARGLDEVVIVRTSELAEVFVDPARGTVRVGGGTVWLPAVEAAAEHGMAVLHGSSPDVGIAGYSLGGGIGWYARKLGLATNSLTAVELVVADGTVVRADATTNADLFWAARGGGGNFGVVTALEFAMYPIQSAYAGMLVWDIADAEAVLRTWAAWAPEAPDEITTAFRILRLPPLPELPEALRGRNLVVIDGAVLGSDELGASLIAGLRDLRPEIDTFERAWSRSLVRLHMDPEGEAPAVSDSVMLGSLPDSGVDAFLAAAGPDARTTLLMAELRQLGGALGRPHEGGGALTHLAAPFVSFGLAMAMTPEMAAQGHADALSLSAALAPYANGRNYLNFAENVVDAASAYDEGSYARLRTVRAAVDPHGLFLANHALESRGGRRSA